MKCRYMDLSKTKLWMLNVPTKGTRYLQNRHIAQSHRAIKWQTTRIYRDWRRRPRVDACCISAWHRGHNVDEKAFHDNTVSRLIPCRPQWSRRCLLMILVSPVNGCMRVPHFPSHQSPPPPRRSRKTEDRPSPHSRVLPRNSLLAGMAGWLGGWTHIIMRIPRMRIASKTFLVMGFLVASAQVH